MSNITISKSSRTVVKEVREEVYSLDLNYEQISVLGAFLRHVGGPPVREDGSVSMRGILTDQIGTAIADYIGVHRIIGAATDPGREMNKFVTAYIPAVKTVQKDRARY